MQDLIPSLKILAEINGTQAGADRFSAVFDIDQIFLSMAFEYLGEDWDAYWTNSRNYALYLDVSSEPFFLSLTSIVEPLSSLLSLFLSILSARDGKMVLHPSRL